MHVHGCSWKYFLVAHFRLEALLLNTTDELKTYLHSPPDLLIYPFGQENNGEEAIIYLSSITDTERLEESIKRPLNQYFADPLNHEYLLFDIKRSGLEIAKQLDVICGYLFKGNVVWISQELGSAFAFDLLQWSDRSQSGPDTELSLTGPKDAFIENIDQNLAMVRRRIANENLVIQQFSVGTTSRIKTYMIYLNNGAYSHLVEDLTSRLNAIHADLVMDTSQLVTLLSDSWMRFSLFPVYQSTERPDKATPAVIEGRILILMDGTPIGLVLPTTFIALCQTPDDYYFPAITGSFFRFIRITGMMVSVLLPSLYIALTSYNQNVIRIQFMLAIAASREGVPYPVYVEVIIMMILMEFINEATVRLPKIVGGTATIVGGLIIGTAAAQSHLISNIMIIVTAATAIGSYTAPNQSIGIGLRIYSYLLVIVTVPFGLFGLILGSGLLMLHVSHLNSWGVPYLAPVTTSEWRKLLQDTFVILPKKLTLFRSKRRTKFKEQQL